MGSDLSYATPTDQWPAVVHDCRNGTRWTVRFGVCRNGVEVTCARCGRRFVYVKARPNPADRYMRGVYV